LQKDESKRNAVEQSGEPMSKDEARDPRKSATVTDLSVASRIKAARNQAGLTQTNLAHAIGVTFQQVQKYENGTNRVTAHRLQQIAMALKKPISYFFLDHAPQIRGGVETLAAVVECMNADPNAVRILNGLPRLTLHDTKLIADLVERIMSQQVASAVSQMDG
jgi:transcriptional regulator with XRE-family HTH domain